MRRQHLKNTRLAKIYYLTGKQFFKPTSTRVPNNSTTTQDCIYFCFPAEFTPGRLMHSMSLSIFTRLQCLSVICQRHWGHSHPSWALTCHIAPPVIDAPRHRRPPSSTPPPVIDAPTRHKPLLASYLPCMHDVLESLAILSLICHWIIHPS